MRYRIVLQSRLVIILTASSRAAISSSVSGSQPFCWAIHSILSDLFLNFISSIFFLFKLLHLFLCALRRLLLRPRIFSFLLVARRGVEPRRAWCCLYERILAALQQQAAEQSGKSARTERGLSNNLDDLHSVATIVVDILKEIESISRSSRSSCYGIP